MAEDDRLTDLLDQYAAWLAWLHLLPPSGEYRQQFESHARNCQPADYGQLAADYQSADDMSSTWANAQELERVFF